MYGSAIILFLNFIEVTVTKLFMPFKIELQEKKDFKYKK